MLNEANDDFSFSGLKTSVRYFLRDHPGSAGDPQHLRDLCASVQAAIVEVLVTKTFRAATPARASGVSLLPAASPATAPSAADWPRRRSSLGLKLRLADRGLCTDNAAMIGIVAERKLMRRAETTSPDADILPNWPLQ